MKTSWIDKVLAFFAVTFFWGCEGMEINKVKNGTLNNYKQTTIGKAIESSLGNVKWTYFETDKGVRVVEARGLPSVGMLTLFDEARFGTDVDYLHRRDILDLSDFCHTVLMEENNVAVVQFVLHAGSDDSFEVGYCGLHKNNGVSCDLFLQYIYNNETRYEPVAKRCDEIERLAEAERAKEGLLTDDRDGKSYKTIKIGTQTWMAENLAYEYKVNGETYGTATGGGLYYYTWAAAMDSAGVYSANGKGCGKYGETCSVKTPVRGICPMGWHLPSNTEWETLFTAVGGPFTAGKILKSESGWAFDGNGTDDVGFSALPAGVRGNYGNIYGDGRYAHFWSSTEYAHIMGLNFNYESASLGYDGVDNGVSVRCVKD